MKLLKTVALISLSITLSGCFATKEDFESAELEIRSLKAELESLKSNLGDQQFMALDPKLSFTISDVIFEPSDSKYDRPNVKFKCSLKQTNKSFPLENYHLEIVFSLLDANGNEIEEVLVFSELSNGVLALAEDQTLYDVNRNREDFDGYKLVTKYYSWYPVIKFEATTS